MTTNFYSNYTNLMQQYLENKEQCMDTFMLFRIGDFYECFFDDAIMLSKILGLHLTKRSNHGGAPMCGIPHLNKDEYVSKIVKEGYKVTICEQVEDPALVTGKNLVKREIIQTITPGTIMAEENLEKDAHNYIACVSKPSTVFGIAICDLATGDFSVTEIHDDPNRLLSELSAYNPSEVVIDSSIKNYKGLVKNMRLSMDPVISQMEDSTHYASYLESVLKDVPTCPYTAKHTAGMLFQYLNKTQKSSMAFVNKLQYYVPNEYMILDTNTRKHLELVESVQGTKTGSLLWAIDYTETTMGSRLLRDFISRPCVNMDTIRNRLDVVDYFVTHPNIHMEVKNLLSTVSDIERLIGKASYETANGRDLVKIATTLDVMPAIKSILERSGLVLMKELLDRIHDVSDVVNKIKKAIVSNPPVTIKEGGVIRSGYNEQLDVYRDVASNGMNWIAKYQEKLRDETQVKNLKIIHNRSLGYYIEVPRSSAPFLSKDKFEKMQELTGKTRFRTLELMQKQQVMQDAESNMADLEYKLFTEVRKAVVEKTDEIKDIAYVLSYVDVLQSFAECSQKNKFVRPEIVSDPAYLDIQNGRHPVVEKGLLKIEYTSNDTAFSKDEKMMLITGPNMAGKSTYMRQVALICLMAHLGSHVPASKCKMPIVDRIFTRIGATDNLYGGESTFMMEMKDIKNITNEATERSLVIIDELGRGTSVEDGTAIATAVIEYLHDQVGCKTVISTHYYELASLADRLTGIVNYHMMVDETGGKIEFLHKLGRGVASSSYGVYCAQLAGIRNSIVDRANKIVQSRRSHTQGQDVQGNSAAVPVFESSPQTNQSSIENEFTEFVSKLADVDVSSMTPVEALVYLDGIRRTSKEMVKK